MGPDKKFVADSAYSGEAGEGKPGSTTNQGDSDEVREHKARIKSRHETFNARIKAFQVLASKFRHDIKFHKMVMESVCVLVQCDSESGHPLFEV